MADQIYEEKTARQLDRLSEALDSGTQYQVRHLLMNLSAAEIGDLLESLPITKRRAVWEMTDPELEGEVLVDVNDEVRASLIRDTSPEDLVAAVDGVHGICDAPQRVPRLDAKRDHLTVVYCHVAGNSTGYRLSRHRTTSHD